MSNLLSQASLVMIPSGYKEDVVYSQIPTSGAGDLSFTRASNGTRVNSAGLVEVCPWNLASYSEDFGNAVWSKTNATITANDTTAPNGTTTADKFAPNGTLTTSYFSISQQVVSGATSQAHTAIIYAKAGGLTQMLMYLGNQIGIYFNLSNGQFISYYNGVQTITNYSSEAVGDGWYKYTISISANSGSTYLEVYGAKSGAFIGNYTTADNFFLWGAQLNIGSTAKPYFPTTDRLNVPRLTYQNGGGGCPSLLLEKQSTNLVSYSEQFDNATWNKYLGTVTADTAISPDGTQNADLIYPSSTGSLAGQLFRQISSGISSGNVVTVSAFVKASGKNFAYLSQIENSFSPDAYFNLTTGAITNISSGVTASMTQLTNGWWRISITSTAGAGSYYAVIGSTDSAGNITNTASGTNGILVYGYQVEVSSYPTSYIPTTSSSATRVADACYKTGISSLIGQTEGTLYFELQRDNTDNDTRLQISDGSGLNWLFVSIETGLNPRAYCNVGGVNQFSVYGSAVSNSTHKVAFAYKNNDFKVYIDGVASITQTSGSVPACNQIDVGSGSPSGSVLSTSLIKEVVLFPTRLTNAELASLTTL